MRARLSTAAVLASALLLSAMLSAVSASDDLPQLAGLPLETALERIAAMGDLEVIYSGGIVLETMLVEEQPTARAPLEALREILVPHDLKLERGAGGRWVVVRIETSALAGRVVESLGGTPLGGVIVGLQGRLENAMTDDQGRFELAGIPVGSYSVTAELPGFGSSRVDAVLLIAGQVVQLEIAIDIEVSAGQEIVVSPSFVSISRREPTPTHTLSEEDLADLPVIGGDYFRAVSLLPGVASADFSAMSNIRGGRADEVLYLLDGLELFEPFHLRDFENALSIVAPRTVERTDILSGGFPAQFGDRMSGVLDMTTARPGAERQSRVGLSTLDSHVGSAGQFATGKGEWLASGRLSTADLATDFADLKEDPTFWDLFAKLGWQVSDAQRLRLEWLESRDRFNFAGVPSDGIGVEETDTGYGSSFVWMSHDALIGSDISLETIVSVGQMTQDREGELVAPLQSFEVTDRRELDWVGIKHQGSSLLSSRNSLQWGGEIRWLETRYDYESSTAEQLPELPNSPTPSKVVDFRSPFSGRQYSLFASGRFRLAEPLTVEAGVRFDENEIIDESHLSPRLSAALSTGEKSVLRFAWGYYYQSQRLYELQVEDGETEFWPDERTEITVLSYQHFFGSGLGLRIEAYDKGISRPRARYENLLDPISRFPEVEPDRARIAPDRAHGKGLEILLQHGGARFDWSASYTYSRIEDVIDGEDVPRRYDQPNALLLNAVYRPTPTWTLGATGTFHTGWPRTQVSLDAKPDGTPEIQLGPLYGDRFNTYRRIDLRVSKAWNLSRGRISIFAEIFNLLEIENQRGSDLRLVPVPIGEPMLVEHFENWLGTVPVLGVDWDF